MAYLQLGELLQAEVSLKDSLDYISSIQERTLSTDQAAIYAKVLNTQGKQRWLQGNSQAALEIWQDSEQAYRQAKDVGGMAIAQMNLG